MGWRLAGLSLEHGAARRAPAPAAAALAQAQARARAVALRAGVRGASWAEYRAIRADATRTSYLFDVRDPEEFVRAHPEGAVSAPGGQLVQTLDTFAAVRNARIFICDADDVRGAMTAAWLRQIGWADVFHIAGGLAGATLAAASETPVPASAPAIAPVAAAALVAQARALVLDLANSKDYRRRHIGGALFCERAELPQLLAAHAGRTALVTSPGGRLAAIATAALPGNADVRALAGGTDAWEAAGFPVESGRGNLPERPTDVFYRPYDSDREVEAAMRQYLDWEVDLLGQIEGEPGVHFQRL
jgi:rhodanese-related sulfurtransferase